MKANTLYAIAAIALLGAAAPASAQDQNCFPQDGISFAGIEAGGFCGTTVQNDTNADGVIDGQSTHVDGVTFIGIAATPGGPVPLDADNDGVQDTDANGVPLFVDKQLGGILPIAEAYGNSSTAVGAGARVGQYVKGSCAEGTLTNGQCLDDQNQPIPDAYVPAHTIPANNSTALGAGAIVENHNSTAVGAGATTTRDNQVVLGTEDETLKVPGITSQKSKNRQTQNNGVPDGDNLDDGTIEIVTSDHQGNVASDGGLTYDRINSNSVAISHNTAMLSQHATRLGELGRGVAVAMAMPDSYLAAHETFSFAAGLGGFDGDTAIGAIGTVRFSQNLSGYIGGGVSTDGGEYGWKVGGRVGF